MEIDSNNIQFASKKAQNLYSKDPKGESLQNSLFSQEATCQNKNTGDKLEQGGDLES